MSQDRDAGSKNMGDISLGVACMLYNVAPLSQSEDRVQQRSGQAFGD